MDCLVCNYPFVPALENNEGKLPSIPSFVIGTNIFGNILIAHKSPCYLRISFRGQTPRFHTPKYEQGIEAEFDEHKNVASMF
jgi:hypothetical protein